MQDLDELPALPKVPLDKLEGVCVSYSDEILRRYRGMTLVSGLCTDIARMTPMYLGKLYVSEDVPSITQTLLYYLGRELTTEFVMFLARQIVFRADEIHTGPLIPYGSALISEWMPLDVVRIEEETWSDGRPASVLHLYALAGRAAGASFRKTVPNRWLRGFAYKLGFNRRIQYEDDPQVFLGLRFWGYAMPDEKSPDGLNLMSWNMDAKMKTANGVVIKRRMRVELDLDEYDKHGDLRKWACPYSYSHDCKECEVTSTSCNASYKRAHV